MFSALLHNQKLITAVEYNPEIHGSRLYCIDCKVPVIFVPNSEHTQAHFKSTGKNDSIHHPTCMFFKALSFEESIQKVEKFQTYLLDSGMKENLIRLSLKSIDPDYIKKETTRDESAKEKHKDPSEVIVKQESETPNSISSLKAVVKLLTQYEPDILSTVLININGKKIPISQIIVKPKQAHELLWTGQVIENTNYFVYGTIENILRREKVIYINLKPDEGVMFSLVIFDKYFKYFTYSDKKLIGNSILSWGSLKKNNFQEKKTTEMVIKSEKYFAFLPKAAELKKE